MPLFSVNKKCLLFFPCLGCKYNQVNSHFHCIREGCMFSFLLKHQMTSHARKHMRRMLGKNFDRVPSQVCDVYQDVEVHLDKVTRANIKTSIILVSSNIYSTSSTRTLTSSKYFDYSTENCIAWISQR